MDRGAKVRLRQFARWLDADTETPISLWLKLVGSQNGILLESAEVDGRWGRYSILACDICLYISCENGRLTLDIRDRELDPLGRHAGEPWISGLVALMEGIEIIPDEAGLPPITRALYGFLGFGMATIFNPHLQKSMPNAIPVAEFVLPGTVLVFDHLYNRLCQLSLGEPREIPGEAMQTPEKFHTELDRIQSDPDETGYRKLVEKIREKLRQGEAIQVVPSARFCAPFSGDPFALYRRMRRFNASPYMFFMRFPNIALFGSSPEVMVRCSQNRLELSPIAGTRKRGATQAEDEALAKELLADPKDRAEHVMLVDLGRNDLGRIAKPGSVELRQFMQIQRFSHVMHITSDVAADLKYGLNALDVLAATFPAGTVSGAPKFRAMEIIDEMERRERGPYAGCIGWLGLDHDKVNLDMGITIRSMWVEKDRLCWQAGGGIVHDSDPEMEWREVINKSAIMRLALRLEGENVPVNR